MDWPKLLEQAGWDLTQVQGLASDIGVMGENGPAACFQLLSKFASTKNVGGLYSPPGIPHGSARNPLIPGHQFFGVFGFTIPRGSVRIRME